MSRFLSWFLFFCLLIVTTAYPVDHQKRDITPIPNFQVELDPVPQTLASVTQPWIEDTLSNVYTPPFFYFDDKNQIASEATRLTPEQTCVLKSLLIRFYNYDTTKAKS